MASLNVNSNITVTDISQNTVTVNFTCDKTLTDIKLSTDNGSTYKDKQSMTKNSAIFDINGLSNNNYNCYLKGYYEDSEVTDPIPPDTGNSITLNTNKFTINIGQELSIPAIIKLDEQYPIFEIRQNGTYFLSSYRNGDNIIAYTNSLNSGTYSNLKIVAKSWSNRNVEPKQYVDLAESQEFTLVIEGNGGGDSGENPNPPSINNNFLDYMYPMPQAHECIPNGAPSDWKYQSRWENKDKPTGWSAFGGWAQVYRVEGTEFSQNTGVEIKDYCVYGWKNGQWTQVINMPYPQGNFYVEDFTDDKNDSFAGNRKLSNDNLSITIRLTESMKLQTSKGEKYVCYHPFTSQLDYDSNFEYIFTCVSMRKIKWDSSGIDDMNSARYCASCGGDWWRQKGLNWAPDWSNNKGIAQPRISEVTNDWKVFAMTTVPSNWTNGFPGEVTIND